MTQEQLAANTREERIAVMEAMGAKRFFFNAEEADCISADPNTEWIGTDAHAWTVDSLEGMDRSHWKYTLRDLEYSIEQKDK